MGTGSLAELGLFLAELGLFLAMLGRLVILDLVVGLVLAPLDLEFLAAMALPVVLLAASLLWVPWLLGPGVGGSGTVELAWTESCPHNEVQRWNASSTATSITCLQYNCPPSKSSFFSQEHCFGWSCVVTHPAGSIIAMRATPGNDGCLENSTKAEFLRAGLLVVLLFLLDASIGMEDHGPGKTKTHAEWKMIIG